MTWYVLMCDGLSGPALLEIEALVFSANVVI